MIAVAIINHHHNPNITDIKFAFVADAEPQCLAIHLNTTHTEITAQQPD